MMENRALAGDWLGASFEFPADYFEPWVQVYYHKPCKRLLRFVRPDQLGFLYCRFKSLDFKDSSELREFYITNQKPTWFQNLKPSEEIPATVVDTLVDMHAPRKTPREQIRELLSNLRKKKAILEEEERRLVALEEKIEKAHQTLKRVREEEEEAKKILKDVADIFAD